MTGSEAQNFEPVNKDEKGREMEKNRAELLERRLLEEREQVLKELGFFDENYHDTTRTASGDLSAYSFHMADQGTDAMEREKAFLFASAEGRLLYNVDEALRRLYRGEYGTCQMCGKEIGKPRLDAIPQANLCVVCQEKQEKETNAARG